MKPPPLGVRPGGPPLKPASIALSIAPVMACPDICAIIGVTEVCISRSLMLWGGTLTACANTAEVLEALFRIAAVFRRNRMAARGERRRRKGGHAGRQRSCADLRTAIEEGHRSSRRKSGYLRRERYRLPKVRRAFR